jgi:hypothetical protein
LHIVCPKSNKIKKKKELIEKGIKKIEKKLDIQYILNKLLEIDKLKTILLDEE